MNNEIKQDLSDDNPKQPEREPSLEDYDYPDGYVPQKAGKAAMIVAVSAAAVITLAVAGFFVYLFFFNNNGGETTKEPVRPTVEATTAPVESTVPTMTANAAEKLTIMPDLSGLTEKEAYDVLNKEGIKYKVNREFSDEVPAGYIITQSPWPYEEIHRSREALIYISKGGENEIFTSPRSTTKPTDPDDSTKPSTKPKGDDEYILPDSDSKILTEDDLEPLDQDTLSLALNEIFARHGRIFSDPEIKSYFESKSWYSGTVSADDFDESVFNSHEIYNINLISSYQEQMGYR